MDAKSLLFCGALTLSLCWEAQLACASRDTAGSGQNHPSAGLKLAWGGVPGPMVEDLRRGRRYDGPEYYDPRSGRWHQGYPRDHRSRDNRRNRHNRDANR